MNDSDVGPKLLEGRVALVTGAGRGIGRAEAAALADAGANVVVNDTGVAMDGSGTAERPADQVVAELVALGVEAVADDHDISRPSQAEAAVQRALDTWGRIDIVVNNAGIGRPHMLFNMTDDEWDDVLRVHLTGAFGTTRAACRWWRAEAKAGRGGYGRIVNTATGLLLYGGAGQSNYTAAKAGVVGFTESIAMEMAPYGVTANAIMPSARTRLAGVGWRMAQLQEEATDTYDPTDPCHVAAMVCYLATPAAGWVSGQTFQVRGGIIEHVQTFEPDRTLARDDAGWSVGDLVAEMPRMFGAGTRRPMPPPKEWQDQYHARGAPATAEPAGAAGR